MLIDHLDPLKNSFIYKINLSPFRKSILKLLKHGASRLKEHNITCVIEPLSIRPSYYLRCYLQASKILEKLDQSNLKLLVDSFHLQMLNGNHTSIINELKSKDQIGHVQISQAPLRDSPMNIGEINFDYFLGLVAKSGYEGWIGLEYNGWNSYLI
jgi:hydroxypyruvate isomerase